MKKLLYTLFAFAIVIVACEKDMDDNYDASSISPIEAEVVTPDLDIDALVARLSSFDVKSMPKSNGPSTARSTSPCVADTRVAPTGATNYISYEVFLNGTNLHAVLRSEDSPAVAALTPLVTVYLVQDGTGSDFDVIVNGSTISSGTSAGLIGLMALPTFIAVEDLDGNGLYTGRGTTAAAGLDCVASTPVTQSWVEDPAGTWTHPVHGQYVITNAPFPLTGFLATTSETDSANYAGTTEQAVRDAIEADLDGTN